MKKGSFGWIVIVVAAVLLVGGHHGGSSGTKPTHGSTVCTKYFKGGC
jgi:hypothetical protein